MNESLHFAEPLWLIAGIAVSLALTIMLYRRSRKRQKNLDQFAARRLLDNLVVHVSFRKRLIKTLLLGMGTFLLFVALARPQYGATWVEVQSKGIDLLFGLDTSRSMLTPDLRPNRLQRAQLAILDFIEELHGDRIGLLPFAGSSYLMCPLTLDYRAFTETLNEVNTDIIPQPGTSIADVIQSADKIFEGSTNHKILILLTDGENLQGDAVQAAEQAAKNGLTVFTVGVGTPAGELIPLAKGGKGTGFIKDESGKYVTSKLDEEQLRLIAEKAGGIYVPLGISDEGLQTIYREKLASLSKSDYKERKQRVPIERFGWPLAAGILLLTLELLLTERKPTPRSGLFRKLKRLKTSIPKTAISGCVLGGLLLLSMQPAAFAGPGEDAYKRGDYLQASEYYRKQLEKHPKDPKLNYNYGSAAYQNNMFDDAIEAFTRALKGGDIPLQKDGYYNLGNSYFKKGQQLEKGDPEKAQQSWRQAIEAYDATLQLDKTDRDAKQNREIVTRKLKELEKQQQKQDKQKNNEQAGQKDTSGNGNKGKQGNSDSKQAPSQDTKKQNSASEQNSRKDSKNKESAQQDNSAKRNPDTKPGSGIQPATKQDTKGKSAGEGKDTGQLKKVKPGTLTPEEAQQLLNSLKGEEGLLNFLPRQTDNDDTTKKDW